MIFVECFADTTLVKSLGIKKKKIIHAHTKGNVCNRLKKSQISKGLVDEDPESNQPGYINNLKLILNEMNIKIYHDNINKNHLIVLCPRLEEWIIKAAKEAKIDIKKYGYPDDARELHRINYIKNSLDKFENLIKTIKAQSNMLKFLEKILKE